MISVIVPAYNVERTILSTINSIQQQTVQDIEIIVINDGSNDRTLELLATVTDERLKVYSYPNGGLSNARNRGITHAQGEYISFIDADDMWTQDKLEAQLAALEANPEASVAYSWTVAMVEATDNVESVSFTSSRKANFTGNIYSQLLLNNFIGNGSNILAKSKVIDSIGNFDPSLKSCEDWDYYLRLAAKYDFILVPKHQILYRKAPESMTSKGSIMEREGLRVIDKTYQTTPQKLQHLKNKSIARFLIVCGRIYSDRKCSPQDIVKARQRLFKAIRLDPLTLFTKDSRILLFKVLLKQLLPNHIVNSLISILKKPLEMEKFK